MIIKASEFRLTKRPAFIVFEGINGCGKTTLLRNVSKTLVERGERVRETREPGGTPLGQELRRLLLDWQGDKKSDRAELLLFGADRAEHIEKVILPSLAAGESVLCDRFIYSTIAFQGNGRGLDRSLIESVNTLAVGETYPDLVVLLDLDVRTALNRAARRQGVDKDSFEDESVAFHERIRSGFMDIAVKSPPPFLILDGTLTPEELLQHTLTVLGA